MTCAQFMNQAEDFNWTQAEDLLGRDYGAFATQFNEGQNRKTFELNNAAFTNKYGQV